ncbi:MAG: tungstate ABC transporter substrate-binding protein WtpA [Candidatus Hadarchaeota archaeon]|nr:tungstate ABC transporter substrate-binding protein WtpA [Candidatus Hadarchaeota archaeon]
MEKGVGTEKIIIALIAVIVVLGVLVFSTGSKPVLKVYHAGSLTVPLEEIEIQFESSHDVDVQLEPHGSVEAISQITELHKAADILASADYSLIPKIMFPEYANWYIQFARNEMVLAYTAESDYANEINDDNWYEILSRPGVRFGFSSPNLDPCGYRTAMIFQLAEIYYDNSTIFDDLIEAYTDIKAIEENDNYLIEVPEDLDPNTEKLEIADKSVSLLVKLEEHSIDYAFEYRSVAVQHSFKLVELPDEINLTSIDYENTYKRVREQLANGKLVTAKPIVYGITIPKNAPNEDLAIEFIMLLIAEDGQRILENCGQPPIVPAVASDIDKLPEDIQPLVTQ